MSRHVFQVTVLVDVDEEFSDSQFKSIQKVLDDSVEWMLKEIDVCSDAVQDCLNSDLIEMKVQR